MPDFDRYYELDEAQRMIPWVQEVFRRIHQVLRGFRPHGAMAPLPRGGEEPTDRPRPGAGELIEALPLEGKRKLAEGLVAAIQERGIVIQDLERGLIDFPSLKLGEPILLCYELSDGDRIQFWHALDAGYAGRRPIEDLP